MTQFSATTENPTDIRCNLLVIGLFENENRMEGKIKNLDKALGGLINEVLENHDFTGKARESLMLYTQKKIASPRVLLLGLGKRLEYNLDALRTSLSATTRFAQMTKVKKLGLVLPDRLPKITAAQEAGQTVAETLGLAWYKFIEHKRHDQEHKNLTSVDEVLVSAAQNQKAKTEAGLLRGKIVAEAVNFARDLANHPSNVMTPQKLAEHAVTLAKTYKLKVKILEKEEMQKLGMGALLAVNQGSALPPKFIVLEYLPRRQAGAGKKTGAPTVLVGKGITFDSGGISIKPSAKMEEMKFDMAGAAAVLGIFKAASELKLKKHLIGLIPVTENLPSGTAVKPGDVVVALSGKTIEVVNTDAEGRMILADALAYAARYKPAAVLDFATLTGAVTVALGPEISAVLGNDEKLLEKLQKASVSAGEKIWPLPLEKNYKPHIKSSVADIKNVGAGQGAGVITGALFLAEFVSYPWAHFDIGGTAYTTEEKPGQTKGATGAGVRLALEFLK
jgi:leucyl aminopeptidase